ncbi:MAG TPA: hypothetical protein VE888_11080 [Streptosporangiaceae bacterium]|nr:hypothetical protein [Streptosporangiaceae bacterium]
MVMETGIPEPLFAVPRHRGHGRGRRPGHPLGLDAGEITDKGYVNQRRVLANRAALVELLYAQPGPEDPETPGKPELPAGVIEAERTA